MVTRPNTVWSSIVAGVFILLMFMAIRALDSGPALLAPLVAAGAASLYMGFRGTLARPQPAWYRRVLEVLAVLMLIIAAVSAAVAGILVVLRLAR
jgi:hypothetical protein